MSWRQKQEAAIAAMTTEERQRSLVTLRNETYVQAHAVSNAAGRLLADQGSAVDFAADQRQLLNGLRSTIRAATTCSLLLDGDQRKAIEDALGRVDRVVPDAVDARDVFEHIDDYTLGVGKRGNVGFPVQFYERGMSYLAVRVGPLRIDVAAARDAAEHLANVVIAGHDVLGILGDETENEAIPSAPP